MSRTKGMLGITLHEPISSGDKWNVMQKLCGISPALWKRDIVSRSE